LNAESEALVASHDNDRVLAAVDECLRAAGLSRAADIGEPITGGLNNLVLPVRVDRRRYCAKIYAERRWPLVTRELACFNALQRTSVRCPRLVGLAPEFSTVLMTWVDGRPLPAAAWSPAIARQFAVALTELHDVPLSEPIGAVKWPVLKMVDRVTSLLAFHPEGQRRWMRVTNELRLGDDSMRTRAVLGRGDPATSNVLLSSSGVGFVDFENAGLSEAAWECADLLEHPQNRDLSQEARQIITATLTDRSERDALSSYRYLLRVFWAARSSPKDLDKAIGSWIPR
jgi:thiamine kinase-like enzyme